METKAKKSTPPKNEDTKAKAETKKKDVAESKADTKTTAKVTAEDNNSGSEFREFFIDELKDILWAEKALLKALPKMRKASTGKELADSFDAHLSETEEQISILEQVFELMGEKPKTKKCDAMEGLISETESIISDTEKGTAIRDAGLILAAQKVEHYEIATYGTLAAFADAMQEPKIAKLLRSILRDEKKSDKTLTILALESVNEEASEE
ncbi:ferritin-like domain-containing protein [uncultured Muribaculum sp.]|uniref:YciE/YciF ferroxidase family protein n=1 Tax=uncultured Muribaculum sp. TaxID=1918613 RepID=UPI0025ECD249|nr:ferritin-like domain-containing protein [uncultured Muribaculum sp.]